MNNDTYIYLSTGNDADDKVFLFDNDDKVFLLIA